MMSLRVLRAVSLPEALLCRASCLTSLAKGSHSLLCRRLRLAYTVPASCFRPLRLRRPFAFKSLRNLPWPSCPDPVLSCGRMGMEYDECIDYNYFDFES